jgi:hypothetical protein
VSASDRVSSLKYKSSFMGAYSNKYEGLAG